MDGASFLSQVRQAHPLVTRMLLTGYADLESAMRAVNKGAIFRMLLKPCPAEDLQEALAQAMRQHELLGAEQRLLEQTLKGAVEALVETLALASPLAFSRASSLRRYVGHMARELGQEQVWVFEVAALFAHLGYVAVPEKVLERHFSRQVLSEAERQMLDSSAKVAPQLLGHVPRLEPVIAILEQLHRQPAGGGEGTELGVAMVQVAMAVDDLVMQGKEVAQACELLRGKHEARLLGALQSCQANREGSRVLAVEVKDLGAGMVLESDVFLETGQLLVKKGQNITLALLERLRNFHRSAGLKQPILVRQYPTVLPTLKR